MLTIRNQRAIKQYARQHGFTDRIDEVFEVLENILPHLGEQSHSRQAINRIGSMLLHDEVNVVAPSCPDYSNDNGVYTFKSVGGGVPLLAQLQIQLLKKLEKHIQRLNIYILIADQEAEDKALRSMSQISKDEFRKQVESSIDATQKLVSCKSWRVTHMTKHFPDLMDLEKEFSQEILRESSLIDRIRHDTSKRAEMYHKIGVHDFGEMRMRTIKTAAQYCALAHIAVRDNLIISNHETVNLTWYNRYGAAVLHNAVSIY